MSDTVELREKMVELFDESEVMLPMYFAVEEGFSESLKSGELPDEAESLSLEEAYHGEYDESLFLVAAVSVPGGELTPYVFDLLSGYSEFSLYTYQGLKNPVVAPRSELDPVEDS
jgi:hypothetical protein